MFYDHVGKGFGDFLCPVQRGSGHEGLDRNQVSLIFLGKQGGRDSRPEVGGETNDAKEHSESEQTVFIEEASAFEIP
ncbi:MAG: hypothetical protein BWY82_00926 [Verrucomicrobia bacterium ADurb.Bin474]|nr:MAG: hypothetical protein BWY82_00926 [Verrucomicrobia bacterium ADurb.Bin474]